MGRRHFQPELLFWDGQLRAGLGLGVDERGQIDRASATPLPTDEVVFLPGRALLPGLINAHSHAFQRLIRGTCQLRTGKEGGSAADFWSWREAMYRAAGTLSPSELYAVSLQAFIEMALAGITSVGEFHYLHHAQDGRPYEDPDELSHQVIAAAKEAGLKITLLRVGYHRGGPGTAPNAVQRRFVDSRAEDVLSAVERLSSRYRHTPGVRIGIAPHSVRAVPKEWLTEMAGSKKVVGDRPIHMHVSEQPLENEQCRTEHGRSPVELISESGLLGPTFVAVHAIHLTEDDVDRLARSGSMVCACPSTERDLGDGIVPADVLAVAGVRISLGSDSQAVIHLLDEARQLEGHLRLIRGRRRVIDPRSGDPDGPAIQLLAFATANGGRSLQTEEGVLAEGRPADFFTVDLNHPSVAGGNGPGLLSSIVFAGEKGAIRDVAVDGKLIVQDGRHPLSEKSGQAFRNVARRVFR